MQHDLQITHADSLSAFHLSLVDTADGASHRFRKVSTDVQGQCQDTSGEGRNIQPPDRHGSIINDRCLYHQWCATDHLHINGDDCLRIRRMVCDTTEECLSILTLRTMPTTKPSTHPRTVPIVASCSVTPRPLIKSGPYFLPYVSNYVNNSTKLFTFQYFIAANCLFLLFCIKFCDFVYLFCQ